MLQAILVFIGLSLDSFIVMMQRGANMKELSLKKSLSYTGLFACIAVVMFLLGYGVSVFLANMIDDRIDVVIAALIIFFVGIFQIVKSFMKKEFIEKLDHGFDMTGVLCQALHTSIDIALIGGAYSFYGTALMTASLIAFLVTFISVFIALNVGYHFGAQYQKVYGVIGGILMVMFSVYMIVVLVVSR